MSDVENTGINSLVVFPWCNCARMAILSFIGMCLVFHRGSTGPQDKSADPRACKSEHDARSRESAIFINHLVFI